MVIKVWNNHDMGVFRVNPKAQKCMGEVLEEALTPQERKEIRKVARAFWEEMGLVFEHNLVRGWEKKILAAGRAWDKDGKLELKTVEDIRKSLLERGEIQFHSRRKNGSMRFIKSIEKPAHLCWS